MHWPLGRCVRVAVAGQEFPLGDIDYDCGGIRIGFEICEDAWVANRTGADLASRGVDLILNPSASHFAFGKMAVRERFVLEGSRAFGVHYLYSNMVGNEAGRAIYDGGALIASAGQLVAAGPRFSYADYGVTSALVDIDAARLGRARTGSFTPEFQDTNDNCVAAAFTFTACQHRPSQSSGRAPWATGPHMKVEEVAQAISLRLCD